MSVAQSSASGRSLVIRPVDSRKIHARPQILELKPNERKQLLFGPYTQIWMTQPGRSPRRLLSHNVSIKALIALSPVIKEAIDCSPFKNELERLDRIALPYGNVKAYQIIFDGLKSCFDTGSINSISSQYRAPLFHYHHIIDICVNLGITHIAERIQGAFDTLAFYRSGERCCIDREDVRCAYRDCPPGHPLRGIIVEKVARGIVDGQLYGNVAGRIHGVQEQYEEFHHDLEARKKELWEEE